MLSLKHNATKDKNLLQKVINYQSEIINKERELLTYILHQLRTVGGGSSSYLPTVSASLPISLALCPSVSFDALIASENNRTSIVSNCLSKT